MAVNSQDRSRWYLGNVLWFGGYNSKTDRENNFGFLSSESGTELFFHKNEISRNHTPADNTPVLFREGIGKNGKPTAFNVHLLDKTDEETVELLIEYLRSYIEEGLDFSRWRYRDSVINCLTQSFGEGSIRRLVTSDITATKMFVKKPFHAAYRLTVFKCASHSCEQFGIGHYINHCIGYKCSEIIDARDLHEKCAEGRFICASCGSCCTTHQEKFGNINKGETEQVKYDRLYQDSPFFSS